jgi:hypothetical protein
MFNPLYFYYATDAAPRIFRTRKTVVNAIIDRIAHLIAENARAVIALASLAP